MANVVVTGGVVKCSHEGRIELTSGDSRFDVDGNAVVVQGQEAGLSFADVAPGVLSACIFTVGGVKTPCATGPATTGISAKLSVGGRAVLLDTAVGQTSNLTPWSISEAGQNKLETDG